MVGFLSSSRQAAFDGSLNPLGREHCPIQPDEIASALNEMRRTAEPATCNKRRSLLSAFWNRQLSSIPNPVLARRNGKLIVKPFSTPVPTSRAIPLETVQKVFATMRESKTKARLMMIFYTACRHSELKRLRPEHLHIDDPHPKFGAYVEYQTGKGGLHRNVGWWGRGWRRQNSFALLTPLGRLATRRSGSVSSVR